MRCSLINEQNLSEHMWWVWVCWVSFQVFLTSAIGGLDLQICHRISVGSSHNLGLTFHAGSRCRLIE